MRLNSSGAIVTRLGVAASIVGMAVRYFAHSKDHRPPGAAFPAKKIP